MWIFGLFLSQIEHITRAFPSLDQLGSHGKQSPLLQECPRDISVIPWGFSALGAWGGVTGPPHIQSLLFPAHVNPRKRAQGSAPAH